MTFNIARYYQQQARAAEQTMPDLFAGEAPPPDHCRGVHCASTNIMGVCECSCGHCTEAMKEPA